MKIETFKIPIQGNRLYDFLKETIGKAEIEIETNGYYLFFRYSDCSSEQSALPYKALFGVTGKFPFKYSQNRKVDIDLLFEQILQLANYWTSHKLTMLQPIVSQFKYLASVLGFRFYEPLSLAKDRPELLSDWFTLYDTTPNSENIPPEDLAPPVCYKLMPDRKTFVFNWGTPELGETYITIEELEALRPLVERELENPATP